MEKSPDAGKTTVSLAEMLEATGAMVSLAELEEAVGPPRTQDEGDEQASLYTVEALEEEMRLLGEQQRALEAQLGGSPQGSRQEPSASPDLSGLRPTEPASTPAASRTFDLSATELEIPEEAAPLETAPVEVLQEEVVMVGAADLELPVQEEVVVAGTADLELPAEVVAPPEAELPPRTPPAKERPAHGAAGPQLPEEGVAPPEISQSDVEDVLFNTPTASAAGPRAAAAALPRPLDGALPRKAGRAPAQMTPPRPKRPRKGMKDIVGQLFLRYDSKCCGHLDVIALEDLATEFFKRDATPEVLKLVRSYQGGVYREDFNDFFARVLKVASAGAEARRARRAARAAVRAGGS